MSIKNIIQQENDLQEMSMQSLANYLNNPTGQYNPYLVAGELQRKEAFAQRQTVEAPQETVVDDLLAEAMPMGGMPRGGMPRGGMPMPQPRPEEVMVSDTITETGIANLPAPNIGQNYAEGGIIGYKQGGLNKALDLIEKIPGVGKWVKRGKKAKKAAEQIKKKPTPKPKPKQGELFPETLKPKKPLTKKQKADAKAKKIKDDKAKAAKKAPKKGPLTRKVIEGAKWVGPRIGPGIRKVGRGVRDYWGELGVAGGLGLGINALVNEGVWYGETPEEKAQREAKELYNSPAEVQKRKDAARYEAGIRAQQARADEQEAALKKRREKEMYLALALGGAKTMAGQSPYALTNIGEGMGAGLAGLAAYDQNEMERVAASQAATLKAQQDMRTALMEYEMKYYDRVLKLDDNEKYTDALEVLDDKLAEGTLVETDYVLAKEALLKEFAGLDPASYGKRINGQQFYAAE